MKFARKYGPGVLSLVVDNGKFTLLTDGVCELTSEEVESLGYFFQHHMWTELMKEHDGKQERPTQA